MAEKILNEKEGSHAEDVLSSIESLEKNISKIKARLETELLKKEKDKKEAFDKTKVLVDDIIVECKKKLDEKEKELSENKNSIKSIVSEYDKLLKTKDEYITDLKKRIRFDSKISEIVKKNEEMEKEISVLNDALTKTSGEKDKQKEAYERKLSDMENLYKSKIDEELSKIAEISSRKASADYKQKLSDKESELSETKSSVKTLVSEYDKLLKTKEEEIQSIKNDNSSKKESISALKQLGLPEDIISLSKEKILKKMAEIIKENLILAKNINALRQEIFKKDEDYNTTKKAYNLNIENLNLEFSKLSEKNSRLESNLKIANEKAAFLENELIKNRNLGAVALADLKKEYERRMNDIISKKTKEQIDLEVSLNLLQKQLDEYQKTLSDKELKKEEFLREVEQMIKNTVTPKALDLLKNYEENSTLANASYSENRES